jgi:hypothetical protein
VPARSLSHNIEKGIVKMLQQDELKVVADSTSKNLATTSEIPVSIVDITTDLCNPLLWSVILQTDKGTRIMSVKFSSRKKILKMKDIKKTV